VTRPTRTSDMDDIKGILSEHTHEAGELRALSRTAERLEKVLGQEVPYRAEFKAQLRQQLVAMARPAGEPWYRRVSVWGSGLGLVAAAAVLVIGLQLLQGGPVEPPGMTALPPNAPEIVDRPRIALLPRLTNQLNLTTPQIPDEVVRPTSPEADPSNVVNAEQGLRVYTLTARPNEEQFTDLAVRLGVSAMIQRVDRGFQAFDDRRKLQMTMDGMVQFEDLVPPQTEAAPVVNAIEARAIARRFLDRAALPVLDLQPAVHEERTAQGLASFTVSYAPRVDQMPVINGRTLIRVSSQGHVDRAEAFVASGHQTTIPYAVISKEDAILAAKERGDFVPSANVSDLVLVRTVGDQAVYLQPYWRIFGQSSSGVQVARYVPALVR